MYDVGVPKIATFVTTGTVEKFSLAVVPVFIYLRNYLHTLFKFMICLTSPWNNRSKIILSIE